MYGGRGQQGRGFQARGRTSQGAQLRGQFSSTQYVGRSSYPSGSATGNGILKRPAEGQIGHTAKKPSVSQVPYRPTANLVLQEVLEYFRASGARTFVYKKW